MLRLFKNKKAQSTAEYAILITLIIAAFSAMQIYVRRGLNARLKAGTDTIPMLVLANQDPDDVVKNAGVFGSADVTQYEPYYVRKGTADLTTVSSEGAETGTLTHEGGIRGSGDQTTSRTGTQVMEGYQNVDLE